eukprot:2851002-Alexandrium_andersonii.AAC.1
MDGCARLSAVYACGVACLDGVRRRACTLACTHVWVVTCVRACERASERACLRACVHVMTVASGSSRHTASCGLTHVPPPGA